MKTETEIQTEKEQRGKGAEGKSPFLPFSLSPFPLSSAPFLLFLLLCGCTTVSVEQTDTSPNERIIESKIRATAWFSSSQNIAKIKALQTDKTQSFGADGLSQQGATNSVAALNAVARIMEALRPAP